MSTISEPDKEHGIETALGRLLQSGVLIASAVVAFGGVLYLLRHGWAHAEYHVFRGEPTALLTVRGTLHEALRFNSRAIIQMGLLVLIATPVTRVAFSAVAFAWDRDFTFVLITSIVLAILVMSLMR